MPNPAETTTPAPNATDPPEAPSPNAPDATQEYTPVHFTADSLPRATGTMASAFATVEPEQQRKAALDLFNFLWASDRGDMLRLNMGTALLTALVAVPGTCMVKVVYGFGVGAAGIGEENPLQNKFLMMHGDGARTIGLPEVLVLKTEVCQKESVNTPSDTATQEL